MPGIDNLTIPPSTEYFEGGEEPEWSAAFIFDGYILGAMRQAGHTEKLKKDFALVDYNEEKQGWLVSIEIGTMDVAIVSGCERVRPWLGIIGRQLIEARIISIQDADMNLAKGNLPRYYNVSQTVFQILGIEKP